MAVVTLTPLTRKVGMVRCRAILHFLFLWLHPDYTHMYSILIKLTFDVIFCVCKLCILKRKLNRICFDIISVLFLKDKQ